jgi:hypothetical protein
LNQPRRGGPAAILRGSSIALLTVSLAVAAHAFAGGVPSGGGIALLILLAGTIGAMAAIKDSAGGATALVLMLTTGQILGHLVLACGAHAHTDHSTLTPAMIVAHGAAVVLGAFLITAGGRFCQLVSTAVRALAAPSLRPVRLLRGLVTTSDQPLLSLVLVGSSLSYRGPPVSLAR